MALAPAFCGSLQGALLNGHLKNGSLQGAGAGKKRLISAPHKFDTNYCSATGAHFAKRFPKRLQLALIIKPHN